jgi:Transposase DDE domain
MKDYVSCLAGCLQALFTTTAEELGRWTGFIQRQRCLRASAFCQTLVFEWMADGKATLETLAEELGLTAEGLRQRLGPQARDFLHALLQRALSQALQQRTAPVGLLQRFSAVWAEDTTVQRLPAELAHDFPGCGGSAGGAAALKVYLRWEVGSGTILALSVHAGRTSDQGLAATAADLPQGGLQLADQGFFNTQRWQAFGPQQYWISRVPAGTQVAVAGVWQKLAGLLAGVTASVFDAPVALVETTQLPCRLVALRCPQEVASRRRQKLRAYTRDKKGREPSAEQLALCAWGVYATNVPPDWLTAKEIWLVYRCRWQIELLFKRARQRVGWGFSHGRRGGRVLVELYAKLLGLVVAHWAAMLRGGPLDGISVWKRVRTVQRFAHRLLDSLSEGAAATAAVLTKLQQRLERIRPQPKRSKKPSTRQLLLQPELAP